MDTLDTVTVMMWGENVGALSWINENIYGVFEFDPEFINQGLNIAPLHMGLEEARQGDGVFSFPNLNKETYLGLPGMFADALPDKFGNSIIDAWLARGGRDVGSFSPIERLCYVGTRGMGALEFFPPFDHSLDRTVPIEISELVELAQQVTSERMKFNVELGSTDKENAEAILDILRVGTSAGGARPKAIIAMNDRGDVVSGQTEAPDGYDYWLLKFDGVSDIELGEPKGYGRIEYAYYLMAIAASIEMTACRLLEENGRAHFLTKRFDRQQGKKLHMQSLCGIAHYDYNMAGAYSYEQAFAVMRKLRLSKKELEQQYRRMVFNVVTRNQDDHTKNIAFLMDHDGLWKLSPAFDITYSHNPHGVWTNQHQMSINGKRDHFTKADLIQVGDLMGIQKPSEIINEIQSVVKNWHEFAAEAGINREITKGINQHHRMWDEKDL